jgi:hypothetical protein
MSRFNGKFIFFRMIKVQEVKKFPNIYPLNKSGFYIFRKKILILIKNMKYYSLNSKWHFSLFH